MFPEAKITEIYCIADDFCKEIVEQQEIWLKTRRLGIVTSPTV